MKTMGKKSMDIQQARAFSFFKNRIRGFDSDWEHFFQLRTPATAHPQARELFLTEEMNKIMPKKRSIFYYKPQRKPRVSTVG